MYKSSDLGGVNDIWDFRFNIKKSLPPPKPLDLYMGKKTTVQIELGSQDQILHGFDGYWEISKTVYSSEPGKKNDVHKLTNSSHSERWGRKPCTQTKEFRPQWALGTKTMYDSRANHGIPRMGGKNPVS